MINFDDVNINFDLSGLNMNYIRKLNNYIWNINLAYFFILICFCHVFVNSALDNIYKDIFKEDIKHKEIYWLIDLILIILFYSFLKANLLVFIINLFIIVF